MNIKQTLQNSITKLELHNIPSANIDAEVLLLNALNKIQLDKNVSATKCGIAILPCRTSHNDRNKLERSWLYAHDDYELTNKESSLFNNYINRRIKFEPVAYIINKKEFFDYDFFVNKNVLIPRPETELIVEEVLKIINNKNYLKNKFNLIDIGTGSGCILISILNELKKNNNLKFVKQSFAIDISNKAIEIAVINAKKYTFDKNIKFINNDFKKIINQKLFSDSNNFIVTANLPYISNDAYKKLEKNVKDFEPKLALTSGIDGLNDIKDLISSLSMIKLKINQKIYFFIEADPHQITNIIQETKKYFKDIKVKTINDLSEKERIIIVEIVY